MKGRNGECNHLNRKGREKKLKWQYKVRSISKKRLPAIANSAVEEKARNVERE